MKKLLIASILATTMSAPTFAEETMAEGLNVIVTSGEPQTQMMSMVLSMMAISKHEKKVNMVLCDKAGSLAVKGTESPVVKAMEASPKEIMKKLMGMGMDVKLCPLYLPSIDKDESILEEGVNVADPEKVAEQLLNKNYNNLSY